MTKGQLFIISGPSGSGKDTLIRTLLSANPNLRISVSTVTRAPREQSDFEKYRFVTVEDFKEMIDRGEFLEYNEYLGNFYGTPRLPVEKWLGDGLDVLLEIDVNGAQKVLEKMPALRIFILPPSFAVLKERLLSRQTEDDDAAKKRLFAAIAELKHAANYDYVIVNDDLALAASELSSVITASRQRTAMMKEKLLEVLNECLTRQSEN